MSTMRKRSGRDLKQAAAASAKADDDRSPSKLEQIMAAVEKGLDNDRFPDWNKTTFPELPEVVYWMRQAFGLLLGLIFGLVPVTGGVGFLLFGVVTVGIPFMYYSNWLPVHLASEEEDEEKTEGFKASKLMMEGVMPALGMCLFTWVLLFNTLHSDMELGATASA